MAPTILLVDVASAEGEIRKDGWKEDWKDDWKAFLENQHCKVFVARDAETAAELSRELQPDLVLLHDRSHTAPALDLCRQLTQDPLIESTPVVVISSSATPEQVVRAREAGAADLWDMRSSFWNGLRRIESLLRLKTYIDDQAKSVVLALVHSMEAKHPMTGEHSERLAEIAVQLGFSEGLSPAALQELRLGCLLHDIGKIAIPDEILLKPGRLNPQELEIVRKHPVIGEEICAPFKSLRPILPMIRHHHERMDGSGYPDGLTAGEIPVPVRILQIADMYDALTNDRPYRKALSRDEALAILRTDALDGRLDASLVWQLSRLCHAGDSRSLRARPSRGHSMLASYYAQRTPEPVPAAPIEHPIEHSIERQSIANALLPKKSRPKEFAHSHRDQRRAVRHNVGAVAELTDPASGRMEVGLIRALSLHGCFVRTDLVFDAGARVALRITHAKLQFSIAGRVVVRIAAPNNNGIGVEFTEIDAADQALLENCLADGGRLERPRYSWQQTVTDALGAPPGSLPSHLQGPSLQRRINIAERAIAARLIDPGYTSLDERRALKNALESLGVLIHETRPQEAPGREEKTA